MRITARHDLPKLARKISEARARIKATTHPILARVGREACISAAKSTVPYGTGQEAKTMGENAVRRDIRKIYATPGDAYDAIQQNSGLLGTAATFYEAISNHAMKRAGAILKRYGGNLASLPIEMFNPVYHEQLRSRRTGRVSPNQRPVTLVKNPEALFRYIRAEQKRVGFVKSAWAGAARVLGGIRGLRAQGSPGEPDITANWITRQQAPFSISSTPTRLSIGNEVTYADRALRPGAKEEAVRIAEERLAKQARYAARAELRRALRN